MGKDLNEEQRRLVIRLCGACENFKTNPETQEIWCEVFNRFYWMWGENHYCWAHRGGDLGQQARQAFHEDSHRQILKPGKSDQQDNPLFTKDRMKDNRLVIPWNEK